eukprot:g57514.t1
MDDQRSSTCTLRKVEALEWSMEQTNYVSYNVEVKDPETYSHYKAGLLDVKPEKGLVLVAFENNWKAPEWVPLESVRRAQPPTDPATFNPRPGDLLEAMAMAEKHLPYSWWEAELKDVSGDYYLINYIHWGEDYKDLLKKHLLRYVNLEPALTPRDVLRVSVPVSEIVMQSPDTKSRLIDPSFSKLKLTGIHVDLNSIVLLGPDTELRRAQVIARQHVNHLQEIALLHKRTEAKTQTVDKLRRRIEEGYKDTFTTRRNLIKYIIGQEGQNIRRVSNMPGILNVRVFKDELKVVILARTQEQAEQARRELEYVEEDFEIDSERVGFIVGSQFAHIKRIEQEAEVSIDLNKGDGKDKRNKRRNNNGNGPSANRAQQRWGDMEDEDQGGKTFLTIIGTKEKVDIARTLLDMHLKQLREKMELKKKEEVVAGEYFQLMAQAGPGAIEGENAYLFRDARGGRGRGGRGGRGGHAPANGRGGHAQANPLFFPAGQAAAAPDAPSSSSHLDSGLSSQNKPGATKRQRSKPKQKQGQEQEMQPNQAQQQKEGPPHQPQQQKQEQKRQKPEQNQKEQKRQKPEEQQGSSNVAPDTTSNVEGMVDPRRRRERRPKKQKPKEPTEAASQHGGGTDAEQAKREKAPGQRKDGSANHALESKGQGEGKDTKNAQHKAHQAQGHHNKNTNKNNKNNSNSSSDTAQSQRGRKQNEETSPLEPLLRLLCVLLVHRKSGTELFRETRTAWAQLPKGKTNQGKQDKVKKRKHRQDQAKRENLQGMEEVAEEGGEEGEDEPVVQVGEGVVIKQPP